MRAPPFTQQANEGTHIQRRYSSLPKGFFKTFKALFPPDPLCCRRCVDTKEVTGRFGLPRMKPKRATCGETAMSKNTWKLRGALFQQRNTRHTRSEKAHTRRLLPSSVIPLSLPSMRGPKSVATKKIRTRARAISFDIAKVSQEKRERSLLEGGIPSDSCRELHNPNAKTHRIQMRRGIELPLE